MTEVFDLFNNSERNGGLMSWFQKKIGINEKKNNEIVDDLKKAQIDLDIAMNNYEFADEPDLVDYHTYNLKAAQMKYEYLLKKAKENGM